MTQPRSPCELPENLRVGNLQSIFYVPDFISEAEEATLLLHLQSTKSSWKEVRNRRVQNYGGIIKEGTLLKIPLPRWLHFLTLRIEKQTGLFGAEGINHVLLNAYKDGSGIHSHQDGPIYQPAACILSIGASAVIDFSKRLHQGGFEGKPSTSLFLQPRSLLVFFDEAYTECCHSISSATSDVMHAGIANLHVSGLRCGDQAEREGERFSFTARQVLKVKRNLLRI